MTESRKSSTAGLTVAPCLLPNTIIRLKTKKYLKELFPADFICEGIDQTRGWFYSLIAISTFIKGILHIGIAGQRPDPG